MRKRPRPTVLNRFSSTLNMEDERRGVEGLIPTREGGRFQPQTLTPSPQTLSSILIESDKKDEGTSQIVREVHPEP